MTNNDMTNNDMINDDVAPNDAALAASIASDVIRPTFMIAAHRLLVAAEELVADGRGGPDITEAALNLRRMYPSPRT